MPVPTRVSSRLAGLGIYLPETTRRTAETETRLRSGNPHVRLATGLITRMTGVHTVHVRPDGWEASDLAVAAARLALAESPGDVDLLIFASASQDLVEPATSHIVAAKLGAGLIGTAVPVMDVKNACNSVVNAIQVADALICSGQYRRVLIASGEGPSVAVRWNLRDHDEFIRSFPGYTMSDGGAALVMEADEPAGDGNEPRGILATRFVAASRHWNVGTLPGGGTMRPHDPDAAYFDMDGRALQQAFLELGPQPVLDLLAQNDWTWDDFDLVAIHQVALPYLPPIFQRLGVPADRTVLTIADHGNLASVTLPLQLHLARESGMVGPGSRVMLIGLAGGISLGLVALTL